MSAFGGNSQTAKTHKFKTRGAFGAKQPNGRGAFGAKQPNGQDGQFKTPGAPAGAKFTAAKGLKFKTRITSTSLV